MLTMKVYKEEEMKFFGQILRWKNTDPGEGGRQAEKVPTCKDLVPVFKAKI